MKQLMIDFAYLSVPFLIMPRAILIIIVISTSINIVNSSSRSITSTIIICFSLSAQVKEKVNMTKKELKQQKKREREEQKKKKNEEKRREKEEREEKRRKEEEKRKWERDDKDLLKKHKVQITLSFQFLHFAVANVQKYEHRNTKLKESASYG